MARLLPETGLVTVGVRPGLRIDEIKVKAGQAVKKGDLLAVLEGNSAAQAQLAVAEQQKRKADFERNLKREMLEIRRASSDKLNDRRLEDVKALIAEHKKTLDLLVSRNKPAPANPPANAPRVPGPDPDLVISQFKAELFKLEVERDALASQIDSETRLRPKEDRELDDNTPGRALLDKQIEQARAQLDQTLVRSPSDGEVLDLLAHEGEISSGPLLYLGDLSNMVARAEVYQDDVDSIKEGHPAVVFMPSGQYTGKVDRVARLVQPNSLTSLDPRERVDRRIVLVTILLDKPEYFARYVNMQVEVTIKPRPSQPK
ncbi:MAG: HlyD family efflux transporter periplasmic adaptor subunit [Isosphaeraceae bacterium]